MNCHPVPTFRAWFLDYQPDASQLCVLIPGRVEVEVYRRKKNVWCARNPTSRGVFKIEDAATAAEAAARVAKLFRGRVSPWCAFRDGIEDTQYSPPKGDFFAGAEADHTTKPAGSAQIRHQAAPGPQTRRQQVRTVCGKHVAHHLIAETEDAITCRTCRPA